MFSIVNCRLAGATDRSLPRSSKDRHKARVVAHPSKVRALPEAKIKTNRLDSEMLAHILRADLIAKAYAQWKEVRPTKRVLRRRIFLVRLLTMVKNRVRALL